MILTEVSENGMELGTTTACVELLHISLIRYCLSLTQSRWDAEDLAQDTWLKAAGVLNSLNHANPEAYLLRIAKNTWIDQARRKTLGDRIMKSEQSKLSDDLSVCEPPFEIEAAFQALMKLLSPLQRAVFLLRDVFEYSNLETANMLHTTEGAVKAALHRARQSLILVRAEMEKEAALSQPLEEDMKAFLRSLSSAYELGDIATLVALIQQDVVEPAVAIGIVQNRGVRRVVTARKTSSHLEFNLSLLMAA